MASESGEVKGPPFGVYSAVALMVIGAIVLLANHPRPAVQTPHAAPSQNICAESTVAAHDLAMEARSDDEVVSIAKDATADHRYPGVTDQMLGAISAVVVSERTTAPPDFIAKQVANNCKLTLLKQQLG